MSLVSAYLAVVRWQRKAVSREYTRKAQAHNLHLWDRTKGITEEEMFAGVPRTIRGIVTLEVAKTVLSRVRKGCWEYSANSRARSRHARLWLRRCPEAENCTK